MSLRRLVPGGCAIFAVQSRAVAGSETEFGSVEDMAQAYAKVITSRGHGSVRLFGWSLGGMVAHAVAAVLEQRQVAVRSVGMVDPPEPASDEGMHENALALTGIVYDHNPSADPRLLTNLAAQAASACRPAREWLAECEACRLLPEGAVTADEFERSWNLYRAHARLVARFSPRPIRAPLQLWWAASRTHSRWAGSTSGAIRERRMGGSHYAIIRVPLLQAIAEEL
jgi:thioesterase domain-containing protein